MDSQLQRRLAALEAETADRSAAHVWRNLGQTAEQAIVAKFPDGMPADVEVTVLSWLELAPESAEAQVS